MEFPNKNIVAAPEPCQRNLSEYVSIRDQGPVLAYCLTKAAEDKGQGRTHTQTRGKGKGQGKDQGKGKGKGKRMGKEGKGKVRGKGKV
jgi:hypothetical protein